MGAEWAHVKRWLCDALCASSRPHQAARSTSRQRRDLSYGTLPISNPTTANPDRDALRNVAYLYEPYWFQNSGDWVKSLLLFFNGIALLVPDYLRDRPLLSDPALAQPLDDQGLLHRLSPDTLVDQATTEALTQLLDDLISAGAFDALDGNKAFTELSYSRLGGLADAGLTEVVLGQLRERGLALSSEDGVSVPMHPKVRALVLVVLLAVSG